MPDTLGENTTPTVKGDTQAVEKTMRYLHMASRVLGTPTPPKLYAHLSPRKQLALCMRFMAVTLDISSPFANGDIDACIYGINATLLCSSLWGIQAGLCVDGRFLKQGYLNVVSIANKASINEDAKVWMDSPVYSQRNGCPALMACMSAIVENRTLHTSHEIQDHLQESMLT